MRRALRSLRVGLDQVLRGRILAALALFTVLSGVMLWWARDLSQYWPNVALSVGAELVAAGIILFALTPVLRRAQQGGVREHRRLDFGWYIDQAGRAETEVRVLHTFSRLFGPPFDTRFARAAGALLRRGGRVQILLLDPDSGAAAQRTAELRGQRQVSPEIRRNLRLLTDYRESLDERARSRFEVRLYSASPSVAIYQWDERLLVSFLPLGALSGDSTQLEVSVQSALGNFVAERFDELWSNSTALDEYTVQRLAVVNDAGGREYTLRFVRLDGQRYLAGGPLLARDDRGELRVTFPAEPHRAYVLNIVNDAALRAELGRLFHDKYEQSEAAFLRLTPVDGIQDHVLD